MTLEGWIIVAIVLALNIIAVVLTLKEKPICGWVFQGLGNAISLIYICIQSIQHY